MAATADGTLSARALEALRDVEDPEMPINIVDLGLVYGIKVDGPTVTVKLTLTAMGCPASEYILDDIRERLLREPGIEEVAIDIVWDPPWSAARLTEDGRDALESWGLAI
jgi:metal-sulfur cluster biosynthetic enzyme